MLPCELVLLQQKVLVGLICCLHLVPKGWLGRAAQDVHAPA